MATCKHICAAFAICIFLLFCWGNVFAQSVGYNQLFLGSTYGKVKDILHYHDYTFKEMKIGVIKIITYDDSKSHGMLVFDFFERLYTVIITIPVTDTQFDQLQQHLTHKYGEFIANNTSLSCTIGIYRIAIYHNKSAKTATVEYGHTLPLFYPKVASQENPFSQF